MSPKQQRDVTLILATVIMSALLMICLAANVPTDAEITVLDHAQDAGVSFQEYPQSLIDLLERNPETEEFVLDYPTWKERPVDLSGYDRSEGVPLLLQWDQQWGYMKYGDDMVCVTGCGPLCLSMVGYYLTGDKKFYPDAVVEFALENGYVSPGNGSKWTLISQGGEELGLDVKEIAPEEKKIEAYLKSGALVIAVMGPGDFTTSGHFIVITGCADGQVSVNDPNSRIRSEKTWEFAAIKDQFRNLWVVRNGTEE